MDLDRYAQEAAGHCEELLQELQQFGVKRLQGLCARAGSGSFLAHVRDNESVMIDYVRATPSQRKKMHRSLDPDERAVFVLGALYHASWAACLLAAMCRYGVQAGPSYRAITAQAASAGSYIRKDHPALWPFASDPDCPDPFDGA